MCMRVYQVQKELIAVLLTYTQPVVHGDENEDGEFVSCKVIRCSCLNS